MEYDLDKSSHSVYSLNYHLILVVKYRRKVFDDTEIYSWTEILIDSRRANRFECRPEC
jgi:REP element-mobilizing transposase RayT